jgi:hypothetical protein
MVRTVGAVALVAVMGLGVALVPAAPAAGVGAYSVIGTGWTFPGLPCPSNGCYVRLDFTLAGGGTEAAGTANCTFDGSTGADTLLAGTGNGTIECSGGVPANGYCHFDRSGPVMTVGCDATVNGYESPVAAVLVFMPLSANPTTSFAVVGEAVAGFVSNPTLPPTPEVTPPPTHEVTIPPLPTVPPVPTIPPVPTLPPSSSCNLVDTAGVCVDVAQGAVLKTVAVAGPQPSGSLHVVGRVDMYSVPLPIGGSATFPCVVLGVDATDTGGCTAVPGATKVSTVATLVDTYASGSTPAVTVKVCAATITATVDGFGVQGVPGNTIC